MDCVAMNCINLQERFGQRYRVAFDPAYDPAHRPKDKLDPWYMVILCERGVIYPYGRSRLAAEVAGRPVTANRLRRLACTTTIQEGDHFLAVTFDVSDFGTVAAFLKPRRRCQVSQAERERLKGLSAEHGFGSQMHQPDRSQRAVAPPDASA